jgi:hypothetical protein
LFLQVARAGLNTDLSVALLQDKYNNLDTIHEQLTYGFGNYPGLFVCVYPLAACAHSFLSFHVEARSLSSFCFWFFAFAFRNVLIE